MTNNRFKKNIWIAFLVFTILLFRHPLQNPILGLIDDGYSLAIGRSLADNFSIGHWASTLVEHDVGRFRPFYLMYFFFVYVLSGANPIGIWLGQVIVVWLTLGLMFEVILKLTKHRFISAFFPSLLILMPSVIENFFRLGPAEPRQVLFMLAAILYFLKFRDTKSKKELFVSLLSASIAIGTKETSIVLIPFYLILLVADYGKKVFSKKFTFVFISVFLLFIIVWPIIQQFFQGGYAFTNLQTNPLVVLRGLKQLKAAFPYFYFLAAVTTVAFTTRALFLSKKKSTLSLFKENAVSISLLLMILGIMLFISSWTHHLERYMYVPWIFVYIFVALEAHNWSKYKNKFKKLDSLGKSIIIFLFTFSTLFFHYFFFGKVGIKGIGSHLQYFKNSFIQYRRSSEYCDADYQIITYLLNEKNAKTLYTTNEDYEVIYELSVYLSQLGKRDVVVVNANPQLSEDRPGFIFNEHPEEAYQSSETKNDKVLVGRIGDLVKVSTDFEVKVLLPKSQGYGGCLERNYWWVATPA